MEQHEIINNTVCWIQLHMSKTWRKHGWRKSAYKILFGSPFRRPGHEPSPFEFEIVVAEFKRHKSPGIVQITAQLIQAQVKYCVMRSINSLIMLKWRRISVHYKESIIVPIYTKGNRSDSSNYRGKSLLNIFVILFLFKML